MNTHRNTPTAANLPSRNRRDPSPIPHVVVQLGALVVALAVGFGASKAPGQGTVNFSLHVAGVHSVRVYMPDTNYSFWPTFGNTSNQIPAGTQSYSGELVQGPNFVAQLWAAPGANQPESALLLASDTQTFRTSAISTGGAAGLIFGSLVTLPNVLVDCPVATMQVRVWQTLYYGQPIFTWQQAWNYTGDVLGKSAPFNVEAIGGGTNPPPNLLNLRSFSLITNLMDTPVIPLIYIQPQHQSVAVGGNASFTLEVSAPATLNYTWRFNGTNLASGWDTYDPSTNEFVFPPPIVAGGSISVTRSRDFVLGFPRTNVMQLTNVQPSQAGIYSLAVTNICCPLGEPRPSALSSNAVLTVGNPGALTVMRDQLPQIVLNWDGVFFLQSATNVSGPFTDLPGPVVFAPYANSDSSGPRFFRLRN